MGMVMSFTGKGLAYPQMLNFAMGTLYSRTFNASLPGKHYDAPARKEIEACFTEWKGAEESERKKVFIEFMKKQVKLSKLDDATMVTGLVTPPAAMAAKRAGESVPQLRMIKAIPDVIFVPSATVLALVSVKLSRRIFLGNVASPS